MSRDRGGNLGLGPSKLAVLDGSRAANRLESPLMSRIRAVANTLLSARSFNCWRGIMASCFGILLAALSVHSLSAQAGRLESLCNSTDRDLMELGPLDDLTSDVMAVVRSKIAGDVRDYLRTLPAEEARAARTRIRRVTYAQIDSLPASLVGVAKKAGCDRGSASTSANSTRTRAP